MMLADFHVHSNWSDGQLNMSDLVDFYGQRNFKCIAITDHLCETKTFLGRAAHFLDRSICAENFYDYLNMIKVESARALKQYGMLVLPGVEITKNSFSHYNSAHILGIGINGFINPDSSIEEISKSIRSQGGVVVAAHPVSTHRMEHQTYYLWSRREELRPYFDAWEVASGSVLFDEVLRSDLPKIANSDLHKPSQIESWKTVLQTQLTQDSILLSIKQQKIGYHFYKETKSAFSFTTQQVFSQI